MSSYVHIWVALSFHLHRFESPRATTLCFFSSALKQFYKNNRFSFISPITTNLCHKLRRLPAGGAEDQSTDDGVRHNHGRIPTTGRQGQLLPCGRLQSRRHRVRHRFPHRWDREAGSRSVAKSRELQLCVYSRLMRLDRTVACSTHLMFQRRIVVQYILSFFRYLTYRLRSPYS